METKKESIKIRISKIDKDKLKKLSNSTNESLSAYILRKSLCEDTDIMELIPQTVELQNLLNEIYHEIEKCNDEQVKNRIKNIMKNHKEI